MAEQKSVRTSQLISPFGTGAVVELGGESFTCMDIRSWPSDACVPIAENNLARLLGKTIRQPPAKEHTRGSVPFSRFPRWLFCPTCRRLYHYKLAVDKANDFQTPTCSQRQCKGVDLVPMRFVAACEAGHLQDIDWYWWAHRKAQTTETGQCARTTGELYFNTTGANGGDFDSMHIECSCGASNSFEGLTDRPFMNCLGKQPWEHGPSNGKCDRVVEVHPRAASSIYYPDTRSALDLASSEASENLNKEAGLLGWLNEQVTANQLQQASKMIGPSWCQVLVTFLNPLVEDACRQFGVSRDVAERVVVAWVNGEASRQAKQGGGHDHSQHGILRGEWPYLASSHPTRTRSLHTDPYRTRDKWPREFSEVFDQVTLVARLREVRALLGFSRLKGDIHVPVDIVGGSDWLPGVEAFGEGIFIRFESSYIEAWEKAVASATAGRMEFLLEKCEQWGRKPAEIYASPRFIALHTFAHGLIRRLAFDAGYSSSSLRERIYASGGEDSMCGILIYTSDSDSEGSLGGLVRQGAPDRLLGTIQRTLADLSWCSADPVCSEMEKQGVDGMNSAACHACSLVSETSCMYNNSLLDRRLLVGDERSSINALLGSLVSEAY